MGIQVTTITSEEQYNEYKSYYNEIYALYRKKQVQELLELINEVKYEINKWENNMSL